MAGVVLEVDRSSLEKLGKDLDAIVDEIRDFIFAESQENLVRHDTVDTGFLLRSGRSERGKIVYDAPYADSVEYGSPAHFVPPSKLVGWAKRKLGLSDGEAWRAASAVSKKIAAEGTDPQPFIRPAIQSAKAKYE